LQKLLRIIFVNNYGKTTVRIIYIISILNLEFSRSFYNHLKLNSPMLEYALGFLDSMFDYPFSTTSVELHRFMKQFYTQRLEKCTSDLVLPLIQMVSYRKG